MRRLYSCLIWLAIPFALGLVLWRGFKERLYWVGLAERFGAGRALSRPSIWLHAVSLGEMTAAAPLVRALKVRYPDLDLVLTTATPAGRARAETLFGPSADVRYLPYDVAGATRRFLGRIQPRVALIMETELWPNLFRECARRKLPLLLTSARLSARSVASYQRFGRLFREVFTPNVLIAAQSGADAQRFMAIGAAPERTAVIGNVKFDIEIDVALLEQGAALRRQLGASRPVWVAGSTHAGEEQAALAAHAALLKHSPNALLILAPRHKSRFDSVAELISAHGFRCARRGRGEAAAPQMQVCLADTLGELNLLYAASDLAFVGGSLVPIGGHNLLEPAALGLAILTGPSVANGREVAALLLERGALRKVADAAELTREVGRLFQAADERLRMGAAAKAIVAENRGSSERALALIAPWVAPPP